MIRDPGPPRSYPVLLMTNIIANCVSYEKEHFTPGPVGLTGTDDLHGLCSGIGNRL